MALGEILDQEQQVGTAAQREGIAADSRFEHRPIAAPKGGLKALRRIGRCQEKTKPIVFGLRYPDTQVRCLAPDDLLAAESEARKTGIVNLHDPAVRARDQDTH